MNFPADLKYTKDHEWIRVEGNVAYVGITDYAQGELGEIVFVDITTEGETVAKILNDSYNIAVRAGLHCAPLAHKSFGTQDTGTVRAVVSAFTTKNDVVYFANAVSRISKNNKQKKTI